MLLVLVRITFIFGVSLFSVVTFRHLPEIDRSADFTRMAKGGVILCISLFALFCAAANWSAWGMRLKASI